MNDRPVWEERWSKGLGCIDLLSEKDDLLSEKDDHEIVVRRIAYVSMKRTNLAAAAPAMARALCSVEWTEHEDGGEKLQCSWCMQTEPNHQDYCDLDKALTQAGLDDDARETVREKQYMDDRERLARRGIIMPHPRPRLRLVPQKREEDDV